MTPLKTPENNEITYLEADINYTIFHLKNGKKMVSSFTLKKYANDKHLSNFIRVHKSYLLNPNFISEIHKKGKSATITLKNGTALKVARRRLKLVSALNSNL
ncbi:MAG: LytR/AlgR family response regulator transcription factor [Emticicia sp.]|uniref:LytR/AlgR family response regulator transcription factor n=1 Tax=Emticicia sp. TaxID=1930953 RepID=UPI003BA70670